MTGLDDDALVRSPKRALAGKPRDREILKGLLEEAISRGFNAVYSDASDGEPDDDRTIHPTIPLPGTRRSRAIAHSLGRISGALDIGGQDPAPEGMFGNDRAGESPNQIRCLSTDRTRRSAHSKTVVRLRVPRVRIPLSQPTSPRSQGQTCGPGPVARKLPRFPGF